MTPRVMTVPGRLFFGVLGTTLAARNCCFPVFARSPNSNTVVSEPSRDCAPDWTSSGTAGSAGFGAGAGSDFVAGVSLPQPMAKQIAHNAANCRVLRQSPPDVETLRFEPSRLPHEVKDGMAMRLLAAARRQSLLVVPAEDSFVALCVGLLI